MKLFKNLYDYRELLKTNVKKDIGVNDLRKAKIIKVNRFEIKKISKVTNNST